MNSIFFFKRNSKKYFLLSTKLNLRVRSRIYIGTRMQTRSAFESDFPSPELTRHLPAISVPKSYSSLFMLIVTFRPQSLLITSRPKDTHHIPRGDSLITFRPHSSHSSSSVPRAYSYPPSPELPHNPPSPELTYNPPSAELTHNPPSPELTHNPPSAVLTRHVQRTHSSPCVPRTYLTPSVCTTCSSPSVPRTQSSTSVPRTNFWPFVPRTNFWPFIPITNFWPFIPRTYSSALESASG
jgi:hypothetical protein